MEQHSKFITQRQVAWTVTEGDGGLICFGSTWGSSDAEICFDPSTLLSNQKERIARRVEGLSYNRDTEELEVEEAELRR